VKEHIGGDAAEDDSLPPPAARWTFVSNDPLHLFPFRAKADSLPAVPFERQFLMSTKKTAHPL
jgi:hypothetical protein